MILFCQGLADQMPNQFRLSRGRSLARFCNGTWRTRLVQREG
jgi:hypothetical protein